MGVVLKFQKNCKGRNLFMFSNGSFGLAPKATKRGDVAILWLGFNNIMILRPTGNGHYLLA